MLKARSTFILPSRPGMDKNEFFRVFVQPVKSVISRPSSSHCQNGIIGNKIGQLVFDDARAIKPELQ